MNKLEKFGHYVIDKHPLISGVAFLIFLFLFIIVFVNWLNEPMEIIYDPNAPAYPYDIQDKYDPNR